MTDRLWHIDTKRSAIRFTLRHMVFSTLRGRFYRWSGSIRTGAACREPAGVQIDIAIDAASFTTDASQRDALDLGSACHPTIRFRSTRVEHDGDRGRVRGELTIRGVTRPVILDAARSSAPSSRAGDSLAFTASGSIDPREFGLPPLRTGNGRVGVSGRIDLEMDVQAIPVPPLMRATLAQLEGAKPSLAPSPAHMTN